MIRLLAGDARARLAELPPDSVHLCVTSPPYWALRAYGSEPQVWGDGWRGELGQEPTLSQYLAHLLEVFAAVRRVLHPTGLLMVNLGDSYAGTPQNRSEEYIQRTGGNEGLNRRNARTHERTSSGLPAGSLCMVPARFALAMQADGWLLRSAITLVKCLSGGTVVYARTRKGEMPTTIKDLVRLDPATVQLWNGEKWTQVLGFEETPRPDSGNIEIEFRNGERIGCTREHLWPTQRGNVRAEEIRIGDVVPHCRLPEPENVREPAALDDELTGWFVGLYLAEGHAYQDNLTIHGHAREDARHARLAEFAAAFDGHLTVRTTGNRARVTLHGPIIRGIVEAYVSGKLAAGKHLHPRCWKRSDRFLQAVLEGYLSGDGGRGDKEKFWTLGFCCNDAWAQDLRTLAGRLGVKLFLRRRRHRLGDREFPGWKGYLRLIPSDHHAVKPPGQVVAIRQSRARKFWDIAVEDEPHTFALASGILTHNSAPMPESVSGARWERCRVKVKAQENCGTTKQRDHPHVGGLNERYFHGEGCAEWQPCPGCAACSPHGGYVLRWGSGRPTSATEMLYVFARTSKYFWNQEAVRVAHGPNHWGKNGHSGNTKYDADSNRGRLAVSLARNGYTADCPGHPAGANARNWLMWKPQPLADAHYAAFPPWLPTWCIKAGTSSAVCGKCAAPYAPVVEREGPTTTEKRKALGYSEKRGKGGPLVRQDLDYAGGHGNNSRPTQVLAHMPTCRCQAEPTASTVLDPFSGAGTTCLAADRLGRHAVGIEINPEYLEMSRKRIAGDAGLFAEWAEQEGTATPEAEECLWNGHPQGTLALDG